MRAIRAQAASEREKLEDDLSEATAEEGIDGLVGAVPAVELDEHGRRDPDRSVAAVGTSHGGAHALMAVGVLPGTRQCRNGLRVQDQDGHASSICSMSPSGRGP